jgi:hypothetical protein
VAVLDHGMISSLGGQLTFDDTNSGLVDLLINHTDPSPPLLNMTYTTPNNVPTLTLNNGGTYLIKQSCRGGIVTVDSKTVNAVVYLNGQPLPQLIAASTHYQHEITNMYNQYVANLPAGTTLSLKFLVTRQVGDPVTNYSVSHANLIVTKLA